MLPVLTALGLFPKSAYNPLGTDAIEWSRTFRGGNLIPFCANIAVEKIRCTDADYVRILNNQVPGISHDILINLVPLEGCGVGPSGLTDGLCEVRSHFKSLIQMEAFLNQSTRRKAVESGVEWFESQCGLNDIIWQV